MFLDIQTPKNKTDQFFNLMTDIFSAAEKGEDHIKVSSLYTETELEIKNLGFEIENEIDENLQVLSVISWKEEKENTEKNEIYNLVFSISEKESEVEIKKEVKNTFVDKIKEYLENNKKD